MAKRITNVKQLRDEVCDTFLNLKYGDGNILRAAEMSKQANVAIKTVGLQLRYRKDRKEKPEIGFLKCK